MAFRKIDISELSFNPFDKIGKQWMLLTGGNKEKYNTMTASWGQLGVLWNKNVLTCYVRPTRYTYGYIEDNECYTASFLGEEFRNALSFCGSHSGRDCDKAKETGLTPAEIAKLDGALDRVIRQQQINTAKEDSERQKKNTLTEYWIL